MNALIDRLQDFHRENKQYFCGFLTRRIFEEVSSQSKLHTYFAADFADYLAAGDGGDSMFISDVLEELGGNNDFFKCLFRFQKKRELLRLSRWYEMTNPPRCCQTYGRCFFHTHTMERLVIWIKKSSRLLSSPKACDNILSELVRNVVSWLARWSRGDWLASGKRS